MHADAVCGTESFDSTGEEARTGGRRPILSTKPGALFYSVADDHPVVVQLIVDGTIFAFSVIAAFVIRFDGFPTGHAAELMLLWIPVLTAARLIVNWAVGVYPRMWSFFCLCDAQAVGRSLLFVSLVLLGLRVFYPLGVSLAAWLRLPFAIIALEFLVAFSVSMCVRAAYRMIYERGAKARVTPGQKVKRVLLYGAGEAGVTVVREMANVSGIQIVGFVDDDPRKTATVLSGVKVLGTGKDLGRIVRESGADEVVISIVTAAPGALPRILSACRRIRIPARIVPGMKELLSKEARVSHFREIRSEDLLGRESLAVTEMDPEVLRVYQGRRILVTGAGGSIGSELTRQLLLAKPQRITILDKDENSIYELEQELKFRDPNVPIDAVIADLKIPERVSAVLREADPQIVFHAAAHKHVPLMEMHPCEAVLNNVMGTDNLLKACTVFGIERFVFISSDKAVNPTNIMGATKRIGENMVHGYADGSMKRACVRFGNVMGSRGSVVPLFLRQVEDGGPVTVTDPNIVRYFMTIPEAVQLVLCAGTLANGGEIFILNMGSPRKIIDVAQQVIAMCGLQPGKDIQIAFTGLRPGEKMNEELVAPNETVSSTRFEKISVIQRMPFNEHAFREAVACLTKAARLNDRRTVYEVLVSMQLGYTQLLRSVDPVRAVPPVQSMQPAEKLARATAA